MTKATINFIDNNIESEFSENSPTIYLHGDGFVLNEEEDHASKLMIQLKYFTQSFLKNRGYFDSNYLTARAVQYLANLRDLDVFSEKIQVVGIGLYNYETKIDTNYKIIINPNKMFALDRQNEVIRDTELEIITN